MGKKKSKNQGEKKGDNDDQQQKKGDNDDQQQKKGNNDGEGGKKDDGPSTVVLKFDMHCEGCATKFKKFVRGLEGVESVTRDADSNKMTVIGKVDPVKLRERIEQKTRKKVELVSPLPKKDKDKDGGAEKKSEQKPEKKPDDKKSKEPPVTTAVMKVNLHCQGCIKKIRKTVAKTKGYHEMSIDEQKGLLTVKGSMDMKALAETLKEKLKKPVEIVPPPKKDGGEKKEKGGGEKGKGGEEGKTKTADDGGGGIGGGQAEENRIQLVQYGYPNPYMYGYGMGHPMEHYHQYPNVHAPQMFSDENPNACSIM